LYVSKRKRKRKLAVAANYPLSLAKASVRALEAFQQMKQKLMIND
jgi:hypothetical protein